MGNAEKLQKIIANAGFCSRRKAEEYISAGLVTVNGAAASLGDKATSDDEIVINGQKLGKKAEFVYIMLNKPVGYVTTASDEKGRKSVLDLVDLPERVYPVGRLDMYSEGLLLLTNDGDFTYKMTHPSHEIFKEYLVGMVGENAKNADKMLIKPMEIDGYKIAKPIVRKVSDTDYGAVMLIKIREGRNRQIRKMCEKCGCKVKFLKRVAVGSLKLGDLPTGKYRVLTGAEVDRLKAEM